MLRRLCIFVLTTLALASSASAAGPASTSAERFHYSWRLRGGLAWIASLRFPTSGYGELRTERASDAEVVQTQLRITPRAGEGFYVYESKIDSRNAQTLMTYHGFSWGDKSRHERTLFDYAKHLARTRKETPDVVENRVKAIPSETIRDVLTAIYYLRQNVGTIRGPFVSSIYSDGHLYPVVFQHDGSEVIRAAAKRYTTQVYRVSATPLGEKRWPGAVRVWISDDEAAVPVRIEMQRNFATLRLDLDGK